MFNHDTAPATTRVKGNTINLTYDDNGNLTADGLRQYGYDAWNP